MADNSRAEGVGESKAARLHSFLSSVFASLFRKRYEGEEGIDEEGDFMASKRQGLVLQHKKGKLLHKDVGFRFKESLFLMSLSCFFFGRTMLTMLLYCKDLFFGICLP